MKVGFTGTRNGMTLDQKTRLRNLLFGLVSTDGPNEFHHGDCLGADAEAHEIAVQLGYTAVIHPPINPTMRAFCSGTILEPLDYLERNQEIVNFSSILIAAPHENKEVLRSETWSTIRRARSAGKEVKILYPNEEEE